MRQYLSLFILLSIIGVWSISEVNVQWAEAQSGNVTLYDAPRFHTTIDVRVSPNSQRVLFRSGFNYDYNLYSVPIVGGTATMLNAPFSRDCQSVGDKLNIYRAYEITSDSTQVVYRRENCTTLGPELYSVPIDGGASVKLNTAVREGYRIDEFQVSPVTNQVVYLADEDTAGVIELYSVPTTGGTPTKLSNGLSAVSKGNVKISASGQTVVFVARSNTETQSQLYSVPIEGGTPQKISTPPTDHGVLQFEISPVGGQVVYTTSNQAGDEIELYSVPIGGGLSTRLDVPSVSTTRFVFEISPDGDWVLYNSDSNVLHSVRIIGGPVNNLTNGQLYGSVKISPDSSRVVFDADRGKDLYSVPIQGGQITRINGAILDGSGVTNFEISPDSTRVVYIDQENTRTVDELYSVPIGGGIITRLNPPFTFGQAIWRIDAPKISSDSKSVVYSANQDNAYNELFIVPIGGGASTKLNNALTATGSIGLSVISSNNSHVVYLASIEANDRNLYSVRNDAFVPVRNYDVNDDGFITPVDAVYVSNRVGQVKGETNAAADVDNNGFIEAADVALVVTQIGTSLD